MKTDQAIQGEILENEGGLLRPLKKLGIKRILLILLAALLLLHLAVSNWYLPLSQDNIRSRDNSLLTHSPFSGKLFQLDPDDVAGAAGNYAILESREDIERFCQALNSFRYFRVEKMKTDKESLRREAVGGGMGLPYTVWKTRQVNGML